MNKKEREERYSRYEEIHAIFGALEAAGHDMYEANWKGNRDISDKPYPRHRTELPWSWFEYRQGTEPFETPATTTHDGKTWNSFGWFQVVGKIEGTELGYHTDWSGPRALIFRQIATGRCFRVTGKNKSHVGEDWDYPDFSEVAGVEKTMVVWEVVEQ